jgi:phosphate acetyltransferase
VYQPVVSGIYVAGCEPASGKSAVALGLQQLLVRRVSRLGVFRPVLVAAHDGTDPLLDLLRSSGGACAPYDASVGVTYEQVRRDEARALEEIVARYHALAAACDQVLVVGTDYAGVGTESEFAFNARVALNLGLPVICVVSGHDRRPDEIDAACRSRAALWSAPTARSRRRSPTACHATRSPPWRHAWPGRHTPTRSSSPRCRC